MDPSVRNRRESGASLVELLFVVGVMTTAGAAATPQVLVAVDEFRGAGAARYLAARVARLRFEAVARSAFVGLRFTAQNGTYAVETRVDGNGNGIRARDIETGTDPLIGSAELIESHFPGVRFAVTPDVPAVEPGSAAPGSDPIKIGNTSVLSFSPIGTATSGSLYLRTSRGNQYVVRVFGETGRTRVLRLAAGSRTWTPL